MPTVSHLRVGAQIPDGKQEVVVAITESRTRYVRLLTPLSNDVPHSATELARNTSSAWEEPVETARVVRRYVGRRRDRPCTCHRLPTSELRDLPGEHHSRTCPQYCELSRGGRH